MTTAIPSNPARRPTPGHGPLPTLDVSDDGNQWETDIRRVTRPGVIATVFGTTENDPEAMAYTRLFIAAPELLNIVRTVVGRETDLQNESRNYHDEELQQWADLVNQIDA